MRKKKFLSGHRFLGGLALAAVTVLSVSCEHAQIGGYDPQDGLVLTFNVNDPEPVNGEIDPTKSQLFKLNESGIVPSYYEMLTTKGSMIYEASFHSDMGVFGYKYGNDESWGDSFEKHQNWFRDEETKVEKSTNWTLKNVKWPGENYNVTVFAYAPYTTSSNNITIAKADSVPTLSYVVDTDIKKQIDLVMASAIDVNGNNNAPLDLDFVHVLSALRFKVDENADLGKIKSISLKGIVPGGKIAWVNETSVTDWSWNTAGTTPTDYSISFGSAGRTVTPGDFITGGSGHEDEVFMMIPQSFASTSTSTIEIVHNRGLEDDIDETIVYELKDKSWPRGKCINYCIKVGEPTPVPVTLTFDANGGKFVGGSNDGKDTVKYSGMSGTEFTISNPVRKGYGFQGWSPNYSGKLPRVDKTYTAQWEEGADTPYCVKHWYQNAENDIYTLDSVVDTLYGRTNSQTNAQPRTETGFTCIGTNKDDPNDSRIIQVPISGEGNTVINIYYDRDEVIVVFDLNRGTTTTSFDPNETGTKLKGRYGSKVTIANPSRTFCDFSGWYDTDDVKIEGNLYFMPNATYKAKWTGTTRDTTANEPRIDTAYTFAVTGAPADSIVYTGTSFELQVKSYRTINNYNTQTVHHVQFDPDAADNAPENVKWKDYSAPTVNSEQLVSGPHYAKVAWSTTTAESWIGGFQTSGQGTASPDATETMNISIGLNTVGATGVDGGDPVTTTIDAYLGNPQYALSDYDLSTHNIFGKENTNSKQTTANCYVVYAQGTYKFPLVYGNGIKNGVNNTAAYNPTPSGSNSDKYAAKFVNYKDAAISSPYICTDLGSNPSDFEAALYWSDISSNVITEVSVSGTSAENAYVNFKVGSSAKQGNAVIVLKKKTGTTDAGKIVWSWHIWFTAIDKTASSVNGYNILPVNLGWVSTGTDASGDNKTPTATYEPFSSMRYKCRGQKVTFTQSAASAGQTPNTVVVDFKQAAGNKSGGGEITSATFTKKGRCPYYQWGRKDPFASSDGSGNTEGTTYGQAIQKTGNTTAGTNCTYTIGTNIQNPHTFYYYNHSNYGYISNKTPFDNSWNATNASGVYNTNADIVKTIYDPCPPGYAAAPVNAFVNFTTANWDSTNKGHTLSGLWFPAAGRRNYLTGALDAVGSLGYYWYAVPFNASNGRMLNFSSSSLNPANSNSRSYGYSVRPVAEK